MKNEANRFRGQYDKNSFSILSQRSQDEGSVVQLCNGIRVDFEYILTRTECCEGNVRLIKGTNFKLFLILWINCFETHWLIFSTFRHSGWAVIIKSVSKLFRGYSNYLKFYQGDTEHIIPFLSIKKDPCSNADEIVKRRCQESPIDCPDEALKHCNENNLDDGGNCFIQARNS